MEGSLRGVPSFYGARQDGPRSQSRHVVTMRPAASSSVLSEPWRSLGRPDYKLANLIHAGMADCRIVVSRNFKSKLIRRSAS